VCVRVCAQVKVRVLGSVMTALRIEEDVQRRALQGDRCATLCAGTAYVHSFCALQGDRCANVVHSW